MNVSVLLSIISIAWADVDTAYTLPAVDVTVPRHGVALERIASPSTSITGSTLSEHGINRTKSLGGIVPGLNIPDYGASLTSTIYLRGFGSRMDNPAMGMYIDDFPVTDKNMYDFDWDDVRSVTLLRGPQATLYGRNAMAGALSLNTLSAADVNRIRLQAEYGTGNTFRTNVAIPAGDNLFSAGFSHTDGFFMNEYKGSKTDSYSGGNINWRWEKCSNPNRYILNTLRVNMSDEGGFAYGICRNGRIYPVSYNDEGSYRRISLMEGFRIRNTHRSAITETRASLQLLADQMRMDQDFTPESVFTLEQKQRSGTLTAEFTFRPIKEHKHWQPKTGMFGFFKTLSMSAPVNFKQDGINSLILENANSHIPDGMGHLEIQETQFPVESDFMILSWNTAIYHESLFTLGRWLLTAGLRLDYEESLMQYDSRAQIHYRFVPTMSEYRAFSTSYKGIENQRSIEVLPRLSALYTIPLKNEDNTLAFYTTLSKGFRAGGFNTQIFSDIMQARMMNGLMQDLGVYPDNETSSVGAGHTVYNPEEVWNYELGIRFIERSHIQAEMNVYYMDGLGQQLTVFPPGKNTGRMMTNAGHSRSIGAEVQLQFETERLNAQLSYSWCDARFLSYNDGNNDYSGNRIPYVPEHTLYAGAAYRICISEGSLSISADILGNGPFTWNESGTLEEPLYCTIGGGVSWYKNKIRLSLRGDNLSGRQHPVFYFKSVGHEFYSLSKPGTINLSITINL